MSDEPATPPEADGPGSESSGKAYDPGPGRVGGHVHARRPPGGSRTLSCLLLSLLGVGIGILGLCLLSAAFVEATGGGSNLTEQLVTGSGDAKVALIQLQGVISRQTGGGLFGTKVDLVQQIKDQLDRARKDPAVKAVLLSIDSPGGTVSASDEIRHEIETFKKESGKPVVVHMGALCASGGYYVASCADTIVCEPTTITGSIGVILETVNYHGLMKRYGVQGVTVTSGPNKDLLNPTAPIRAGQVAIIQSMVNTAYARFVKLVSEGRHIPLAKVKALADGRIYTARRAKQLKLVDSIGYREDAFAAAKRLGKVSEARLVRYRKPPSLAEVLAGAARAPVHLDLGALNGLTTPLAGLRGPRLLALWWPGVR